MAGTYRDTSEGREGAEVDQACSQQVTNDVGLLYLRIIPIATPRGYTSPQRPYSTSSPILSILYQ